MITKDQSIIMQVAAKIASELTNTTNLPDRNADTVQATFLSHFDVVNEALQKANGMSLLQEAFPEAVVETITSTNADARPTIQAAAPIKPSVTTIKIAGKQHGDLPNWLIAACQKAGVGRVWDNRDQAVGTKRPWFKQADAVDGQEPIAFWPPRGQA